MYVGNASVITDFRKGCNPVVDPGLSAEVQCPIALSGNTSHTKKRTEEVCIKLAYANSQAMDENCEIIVLLYKEMQHISPQWGELRPGDPYAC